jgi:thymidylate kinase
MELHEGQPISSCPRPLVLSFSGIDGAGKTTQIELLANVLRASGMRVLLIRFWDDVAALRWLRETTGHTLFRGEKGVGAPDKPVRRRDKNVQSWYMLPVRLCLCVLDAVRLSLRFAELKRRNDVDIFIFDRYLYDQVANLNGKNRFIHAYIRLVVRLVPRPHRAFLLDVDPGLACARKPEYPIEFVRRNRDAYLALSKTAGLRVVPQGTPAEVAETITHELATSLRRIQDGPIPNALTST